MKTCRLFVGVIALLTLLSSSLAQTQEDYFTDVKTFSINKSDVAKNTKGYWTVVGTDSVPGIPNCRLILISHFGVAYLDGEGNVLANNYTDGRWAVHVSPDGSKIAYVEYPRSHKPVTVRVESATGDVLWERSDGYGIGEEIPAKARVNNEGAVVIAPTLRTGTRAMGSVRPGTRDHPLLFGGNGDQIAELPVRTEDGLFFDSLSPDGRYYAINFCDIEADSTSWCWNDHTGRNCVGVFDMDTGAELWRHYFDNCGDDRVVIGPDAETVVTGGQDEEPKILGEGHSLYFFDHDGGVTRKHPMLYWQVMSLTMSPSGKYVAGVATGGLASNPRPAPIQSVAVVFEASSGDLLYEYYEESDPRSQIRDLHVSDNGELFLGYNYSEPSQRLSMLKHILLSTDGRILWQRAEQSEQSRVPKCWLFSDGSGFVEFDENMEMRVHSR